MGYKNVCTNCRISLSEGTNYELFNTNKPCPTCKGKMYFVNEKFKTPKESNDKEWKLIEYLLLSGYDFRNPYCGHKATFILSSLRTCKRQRRLFVRCESLSDHYYWSLND